MWLKTQLSDVLNVTFMSKLHPQVTSGCTGVVWQCFNGSGALCSEELNSLFVDQKLGY